MTEGRIRGRRGMGTVVEHRGAWWVRRSVTDPTTGRRSQPRIGPYPTREAALEAQQVLGATAPARGAPVVTWADWAEVWLPRRTEELLAMGRRSYAAYLRRAVSNLLSTPVGALPMTATVADSWSSAWVHLMTVGGERGRPLSRKTMTNVRGVASLIEGAAYDAGHITRRHVARSIIPTDARSSQRGTTGRILTEAEQGRLVAACLAGELGRWSLPTLVAIDTGARRGEVLGLRWGDLDLDRGTASIERQVLEESSTPLPYVTTTKTGEGRTIALPGRTGEALRRHRDDDDDDPGGWVFAECSTEHTVGAHGAIPSPDAWTRYWRRRVRPAFGLDGVRIHDLRHTHATRLLEQGVSLGVVSARLGHSSPTTTLAVYTHGDEAGDRAAADAWE